MKSSTLMVILLVVQAVLIMGIFAAVPIENSAVAGEEDVTPSCPKDNPAFCKHCNQDPGTKSVKCQDKLGSDPQSCAQAPWCKNCKLMSYAYPAYYMCDDDFTGTCCDKKN